MGDGAAANYMGIPQHATFQHPGDPEPTDAQLGDLGSGAPDIQCSST